MSRLGGGIGTRGPGEKKLESDRRLIRKRITALKEELSQVEKHRELLRTGQMCIRDRDIPMKKTALVIMAAGVGSRFGNGIKQLAPVGPNGEIIMDYSIRDALEAGLSLIHIYIGSSRSRKSTGLFHGVRQRAGFLHVFIKKGQNFFAPFCLAVVI